MADCHDFFQEFLSAINISANQSNNLRTGRDAIRARIQTYFSDELKVRQPKFFSQGSFALKTMIRPLGTDYDLDDGVYLQHTDDDLSEPTPKQASDQLLKAVERHVQQNPENKKNCVRLKYAAGYHIDLPVYREVDGIIYLGTLEGNQWIPDDAKAFNKWFYDRLEATEQMRSCIKYLKAWSDFLGSDLKGIHITALVGLNHVSVEDHDDESVALTVKKMRDYLTEKQGVWNPVDLKENLLKGWSEAKLSQTIKKLDWFCEKATAAQQCTDEEEAAQEWRVLFGDRFPVKCESEREGTSKITVPPVIAIHRDPKLHCDVSVR
jgi:cyclic GMP-AMP synthase DncV-like protein